MRAREDQFLRPCLLLTSEWQLPEVALAGFEVGHGTHSPLLERPPTSRGRVITVTAISKRQSYVVLNKSGARVWEDCTYQVVVMLMLRRRGEEGGEGGGRRLYSKRGTVSQLCAHTTWGFVCPKVVVVGRE